MTIEIVYTEYSHVIFFKSGATLSTGVNSGFVEESGGNLGDFLPIFFESYRILIGTALNGASNFFNIERKALFD